MRVRYQNSCLLVAWVGVCEGDESTTRHALPARFARALSHTLGEGQRLLYPECTRESMDEARLEVGRASSSNRPPEAFFDTEVSGRKEAAQEETLHKQRPRRE
jgi:hypothetical protein